MKVGPVERRVQVSRFECHLMVLCSFDVPGDLQPGAFRMLLPSFISAEDKAKYCLKTQGLASIAHINH